MKPKLKVVPLVREPYEEMIAYLREKLEQAEKGKLVGCMLLVEYADGGSGWRVFNGMLSTPAKLLGELELLKLTMLQREQERRDAKE